MWVVQHCGGTVQRRLGGGGRASLAALRLSAWRRDGDIDDDEGNCREEGGIAASFVGLSRSHIMITCVGVGDKSI